MEVTQPFTSLSSETSVSSSRNRRNGSLVIDDSAPVLGSVGGRFQGLDVMTALYLGGVPLDVAGAAARDTGIANGFVGETWSIQLCLRVVFELPQLPSNMRPPPRR